MDARRPLAGVARDQSLRGAVARTAAVASGESADCDSSGRSRRRGPAAGLAAAADVDRPAARLRRADRGSISAGRHAEAQCAAAGAGGPTVPDQPRHGAAALGCASARRCRGAGTCVGRRGRAHPGQGPLAARPQYRLRLHPPRRRRARLQQGHPDQPEHQLLLRRGRPLGKPAWHHPDDRRHLSAPGRAAGPQLPPLGHPVGEERRDAADRRRLLLGPPVPRHLRRGPLHGGPGTGPDPPDRGAGPRPGPRVRAGPGAEHGGGSPAAGGDGPAGLARQQREAHPRAAARPARRGRAARARPPPDHAARSRPDARRPPAHRNRQPPRGRLARAR